MKKAMLCIIRFYQRYISPAFPGKCRFRPTCSAYAYEAISKYGFFKGGLLALKRILNATPSTMGISLIPFPEEEKVNDSRI